MFGCSGRRRDGFLVTPGFSAIRGAAGPGRQDFTFVGAGEIADGIAPVPSRSKDDQGIIGCESGRDIHAIRTGFMRGGDPAEFPGPALIGTGPALDIAFPSAMSGLIEDRGDEGAVWQ